jgi:hypothetical protein
MKRTKRFIAGVSAMAMTAAMATSVSAVSIPNTKSSFSYELTSEMISDTQLEVTFQVTNNPGLSTLSVALQFSGDCEPVDITSNAENCMEQGAYNSDMSLLFYCVGAKPDKLDASKFVENTQNFSITATFDVEAGSTTPCQFSAAVTGYHSLAENINYDNAVVDGYSPDTEIETRPYLLGDVDNDGQIRVEDASDAYAIVAVDNAVYGSESAPVSRVNYNVEYNVVSTTLVDGYTIPWRTRFSYLMRSGYSYAEAADVDRDGYIEESDGDDILSYYANSAASLPVETLIGTTQVKTITVTL